MKEKLAKIWGKIVIGSKAVANGFMTVIKGELLLKYDRYLPHALVLVLCALGVVAVRLSMDSAALSLEDAKRDAKAAKYRYTRQLYEKEQCYSLTSVLQKLDEEDSKLKIVPVVKGELYVSTPEEDDLLEVSDPE